MKIDRLIGILTILLQREKLTSPELAERFEVSRRTILRDIDALCRAGIPITTSQGGDGGIAIMDGYKLDKSILTTDELANIIAGLKSIGSVSGSSELELLIEKLSPGPDAMVSLPDSIIIDLSSYYKSSLTEKIALIKHAINEHRVLSFDYYYEKGQARRSIEPYFIQFKWSSWYVYGYCRDKEDFRLFKLNRLWNPQLTDDTFSPRAIPPDAHDRDTISSEPYHVQLLFDVAARFRLIETYGLNCYTETEDGLLMEMDYTNREFIKSWILSFGDMVSVVSPADLREEMAGVVRRMAERYRNESL